MTWLKIALLFVVCAGASFSIITGAGVIIAKQHVLLQAHECQP